MLAQCVYVRFWYEKKLSHVVCVCGVVKAMFVSLLLRVVIGKSNLSHICTIIPSPHGASSLDSSQLFYSLSHTTRNSAILSSIPLLRLYLSYLLVSLSCWKRSTWISFLRGNGLLSPGLQYLAPIPKLIPSEVEIRRVI
jgi:hypothetical protein